MSRNTRKKPDAEANLHVPKFVRASDYKTIYTNFVQFGITAFDISFLLGDTAGVNEEDGFVVDLKARVVMTPSEAKLAFMFLGNTLREYEKKFGPIVIPPLAIPEGMVVEPEEASDTTDGI